MTELASVSPPPESPSVTKAHATAKYNTLVLKAKHFPADSSHQKKYLAIARAVLSTYPVTGNGGSAARLPPADDAKMTMMSLLPPPAVNFTAEYFNEALAPIIFLHQIATFYGFGEVNPLFIEGLELTPLEASSSSYGTQTWFRTFGICIKLRRASSWTSTRRLGPVLTLGLPPVLLLLPPLQLRLARRPLWFKCPRCGPRFPLSRMQALR